MWKDFILQDFHEDLNLQLKYDGKFSKCLREIKYSGLSLIQLPLIRTSP